MTDKAIPTLAECRSEVLAFARLMEAKLRQNDYKGGWKDCDPQWLLDRLVQETHELRSELTRPDQKCGCHEALCPHMQPWWKPDTKRTGDEAADVANFAMMIADQVGALGGLSPEPRLSLEMVERARAEASREIAADGRFTEIEISVAGHALRIMEKRLRQQIGGEQR